MANERECLNCTTEDWDENGCFHCNALYVGHGRPDIPSELSAGLSANRLKVADKTDRAVVLIVHESGAKEFARMNYNSAVISGSIGFNAVGGNLEKARELLYRESEL